MNELLAERHAAGVGLYVGLSFQYGSLRAALGESLGCRRPYLDDLGQAHERDDFDGG